MVRRRFARAYLKCALMEAVWTGGAGTDVRARDPACSKFHPKPLRYKLTPAGEFKQVAAP
jgi:hypothetical protein